MKSTVQEASFEDAFARFNIVPKNRPLRPTDVAEMTGLSVATLQDQRHEGTGIPYFKRGRFVYYSERDILDWLLAGERRSTSQKIDA
jgi:hypothetical protein